MKKFSLKSLLSKFFISESKEENSEYRKKIPSVKNYIEEQGRLKGVDYKALYGTELKQTFMFKDLKKDVTVDCAVIKEIRPWILEYTVSFRLSPTHDFVMKHRPAAVRRSTGDKEAYIYGQIRDYPQQVISFLDDVRKRFGANAIYRQVDTLKRKIDNDKLFFKRYPIWDWAEPKIAYLWGEGVLDNFIIDTGEFKTADSYGISKRAQKSFQTRENTPIDFGFYVRFELPRFISSEAEINKYITYKAKHFGEELINMPMLTSDNDFKIKPGRIER